MDLGKNWTEKSIRRNKLTAQYEPLQPFIFFQISNDLKTELCLDIGANIGFYTILASDLPGMEAIHSFEASSDTFAQLKDNVALNDIEDLVQCHCKAVSSSDGKVVFQEHEELSGINSIAGTSMHSQDLFTSSHEMECCAIDSQFKQTGKSVCVKIDVEGHEIEVLKGAREFLTNNICLIQIELYGKNEDSATNLLSDLGYFKVFRVEHDVYFSNEDYLRDPLVVLKNIEDAASLLVKESLKKWPYSKNTTSLNVQIEKGDRKNTLVASVELLRHRFSGPPEFAFYWYVGGKRSEVQWYDADSKSIFEVSSIPVGARIGVKAFARDSQNPDRKITKSASISL